MTAATMTTPALPAGRTISLGLSRIRYEPEAVPIRGV